MTPSTFPLKNLPITHFVHLMHIASFRFSLVLVFGLWLSLPALQGQASHEMTLEQAIEYGLEHSRNVQSARFDEYIAQARVKETVAGGYPQINGTVEGQYYFEVPRLVLPPSLAQTLNPGGDGEPLQAALPFQANLGASLSQLVFDGSFFIGVKAAKAYRELSHRQLNRSREQVAFQVSQAFYQALILAERQQVLDANIARVQQLFEETQGRYEEGFVEKIDVDRLRINLNNLNLERQKTIRMAELSRQLLKFQMGMPLQDQLVLAAEPQDISLKSPEAYLSEYAADPTHRVDYQLLQSQRELERFNYRRIRSGYLPNVYLSASYQRQYQGLEDESTDPFDLTGNWFNVALTGLTINVPIFDGLRKHRQMQQSQLELRKLDNQFEQYQQSYQVEVDQARTELRNAYASLQSTEQTRDLARDIYQTTREKYKEGVGSSLEVNQAESDLNEAEANYLASLLEYLLAQTEYQRAVGAFGQYHE
jgi:outer membrane protein